MEERCKSLALQYDLFVNSTLKYLDTATERGEYIICEEFVGTKYYLISNNKLRT